MSQDKEYNRHMVCTYEEAKEIINSHTSFFVSNCGCRERQGICKRSKTDLCMTFDAGVTVSGSNKREINIVKAREILNYSISRKLVTRPFRVSETLDEIGGICFCCDDCCGVFQSKNEECDYGKSIEDTNANKCTECGLCVYYCYFKCREITRDGIIVNKDKCYGCGICSEVCPVNCISMVKRQP